MNGFTDWTVEDFSGGITDLYVDAPKNYAQTIDNLIITKDGKLKTRPGSTYYDSSAYRIGSARVGELFNYKNDTALLGRSAAKLYYNNSGTWAELTGPSGNSAFPSSTAGNVISSAQWKGHLYLCTDYLSSPMKVYQNSTTTYLRNAGLPALASLPVGTDTLAKCYALANDIKAKMNAHFADLTLHVAQRPTTLITAANATDEETLRALIFDIGKAWSKNGTGSHAIDAELSSSWAAHVAQDADADTYAGTWVPSAIADIVTCLNQFATDYNAHDNDNPSHNGTHGSHQVTASTVAVPTGAYYLYGFCYQYDYTVGGVSFTDYGPVTLVRTHYAPSGSVAVPNVVFSSIPWPSAENYDLTNLKVAVFKSEASGTTLYRATSVSYPDTSAADMYTAATITDGAVIYIDGGVLDNDPPPAAKYIAITNNVALYGHIKESSATYPNRIRQSIADDPDSCPSSLYDDFEEEITGVGTCRGKHIILCKNAILRRDGYYDDLGGGVVNHDKISSTAGCVSSASIVETDEGMFWFGNDGIYYTNGYQVQKISTGLEDSYSAWISTSTKKARIQGCYNVDLNSILWTIQDSASSGDNDTLLVLNLNQGIKPLSAFSTWSNGTHFSPTALCYYGGQLVRAGGLTDGTLAGYLFKHDDAYTTDLTLVSGVAPTLWPTRAIRWDYVGPATHFGLPNQTKWVPRVMVTAKRYGNLSLQVKGINNDDATNQTKSCAPIRFRSAGIQKGWTRFPAGSLRCHHKQVEFTNAYTFIQSSDTIGLGTIGGSGATRTLVLGSGRTADWDTAAVGYYLSFPGDNYATQYEVTVRTADTLTFTGGSALTNGSTKWQLKGYPKGEQFHLQSYVVNYKPRSDTSEHYDGDSTGGNA